MLDQFSRTELLIGKEGIEKLSNSKIAIFGLGGVGSFVLEGLTRAGVGNFVLIDDDQVDISNLNRQLLATMDTIGRYKVDVAKERVISINPKAKVKVFKEFYLPGCKKEILTKDIDYIIDCIDTVTAKIELVVQANKLKIPIISAMGTGNKLDPTKFEIADIYKTSVCPLCKVMRKELKQRNIKSLKVVYSKEEPIKPKNDCSSNCSCDSEVQNTCPIKKQVPGSISFVPSVAGLTIAGEVIKDLLKKEL